MGAFTKVIIFNFYSILKVVIQLFKQINSLELFVDFVKKDIFSVWKAADLNYLVLIIPLQLGLTALAILPGEVLLKGKAQYSWPSCSN